MQNNPMSGPYHIGALANALGLDPRPGAYVRPPPTGGDQISVRLGHTLLAHMDVLGQKSGWTRVQVLTALVERGLFDLYGLLTDEIGEALLNDLASELVPVMHDESLLLQSLRRLAREVANEGCTLSPSGRPDEFWMIASQQPDGRIPRLRIVAERRAAVDFQRFAESQRRGSLDRLKQCLKHQWDSALEQSGHTVEPSWRVTPESLIQADHP